MKITHNLLVRVSQVLTHLIGIPAVIWAVSESRWDLLIVSWLTYWFIGIMGINVGMHRLVSHNAFETYQPIKVFLMFCATLTTTGSPIAWAMVHRLHHKHTDTEFDPHSPHRIGALRAWFGIWNTKGFKDAPRMLRGLNRDPIYKFFHNYYFHVIFAWIAFWLMVNPIMVIFVYCIPAILCLHSACGIIVIPHYHGYRTHDIDGDTSRNSWIANIVTMGEGWHNNHHAKPWAWNTRELWWEWDIPAQVIKLIRRPDYYRKVNRPHRNEDLIKLLKDATKT